LSMCHLSTNIAIAHPSHIPYAVCERGMIVMKSREAWRFLHLRAAQLYEEGDVRRALRLMDQINRAQAEAFRRENAKNEQTEKSVSTR